MKAVQKRKFEFIVNGEKTCVESYPMARLLDVLREECGLTGSKEGCGEGECGACSVLLDGEVVNSCLVAVGPSDGRKVTSIEGIGGGQVLHAVMSELVRGGGAQCGISTPGIAECASHLGSRGLIRKKDE